MKRFCYFLLLIAMLSVTRESFAVYLTEDFSSYSTAGGNTLNGQGATGNDWSNSYTWTAFGELTPTNFRCVTDGGSGQVAELVSAGADQGGARVFGYNLTSFSGDSPIRFTFDISNAITNNIDYAGLMLGEWTTGLIANNGPTILYHKDGDGRLGLYYQDALGNNQLINDFGIADTAIGDMVMKNISLSGNTFSVSCDGGVTWTDNAAFSMPDLNNISVIGVFGPSNGATVQVGSIQITGAVPEPSSIAFFGMGLMGLIGAGWRRFKRQ